MKLRITSCVAGLIFLGFGVAKFANHGVEVDSFRTYGLPFPGAVVYLIGLIEVIGGALLLAGSGTRIVAPVLAADMIGAIVVSGIARGEWISLTLAPALLVVVTRLWIRSLPAGRRAAIRGGGGAAVARRAGR